MVKKPYEILPLGVSGKPSEGAFQRYENLNSKAEAVDVAHHEHVLKYGLGKTVKSYEVLDHTRRGVGLVAGCCGYQKALSVVGTGGVPKRQGGEEQGAGWRGKHDDVRYMPMPHDPYWNNVADQSRRSR